MGLWAISVNGSTSVLQADRGGSSPPLSTRFEVMKQLKQKSNLLPAQGGARMFEGNVIWTIVGILAIVALVIFII